MSFMKNRSFNVKMVRDDTPGNADSFVPADPMLGPEIAAAYADIAKAFITHATVTIGGIWAACKVVERICR
jgi:hypothetical protein